MSDQTQIEVDALRGEIKKLHVRLDTLTNELLKLRQILDRHDIDWRKLLPFHPISEVH